MTDGADLLSQYRQALRGVTVAHTWRGQGSAIFLEFGTLTPRLRNDGTPGNPDGDMSLMIASDWRIEEGDRIGCGSGSEEEVIADWLFRLVETTVLNVATVGRLPEVVLSLTNDLFISSFMTARTDPGWALMDHREDGLPTLVSRHGRVGPEDILFPPTQSRVDAG